MFFDWLDIEQNHSERLPIIGGSACAYFEIDPDTKQPTGEISELYQPSYMHRGSYCDSIRIKINGSTIRVSGNPSRWGRVENLFGLVDLDQCVLVFNQILLSLGLPPFTRCTRQMLTQGTTRDPEQTASYDGAVINELHITSNMMCGSGNVTPYIAGLSTQSYRNSQPHLMTDGRTVHWLGKSGQAHLIYACVYDKGFELNRNSHKIKNRLGDDSPEYRYLTDLISYCNAAGVVRFEQKIKRRFLKKNSLHAWGLHDFDYLKKLHDEFLQTDERLEVTAMDFETITAQLVSSGVCSGTKAANSTAMYAVLWMHGEQFDFNKRQVKTHRARLRKIGIDIARPYDASKFSLVRVIKTRDVVVSPFVAPSWYRHAKTTHLSLVA